MVRVYTVISFTASHFMKINKLIIENQIPFYQQRTEIWTVNPNFGFESVNMKWQTKKNYATPFSFSDEQLPERINSIEWFVLGSWYKKWQKETKHYCYAWKYIDVMQTFFSREFFMAWTQERDTV